MLVALLDANEGVTIEQVDPLAERLGFTWRAYMDAGAALGEYRAVVKATGE